MQYDVEGKQAEISNEKYIRGPFAKSNLRDCCLTLFALICCKPDFVFFISIN